MSTSTGKISTAGKTTTGKSGSGSNKADRDTRLAEAARADHRRRGRPGRLRRLARHARHRRQVPHLQPGHVLLIALQAPTASRVAGFRTWKSLGRQVRKGERGIAILAPCTYRPKASTAATDSTCEQAQDECGGDAASAAGGKQLRGFRVVHVFDVAQTEGDRLPDVVPALLTGQAPAVLWDDLAAQIVGHGYSLERGDCSGANGYTDPTRRVVRVRDDVDDAQAVKTLAHELGHLECGHARDLPTYLSCRGRCEVEAESVAYVVAAAHGLDASGYTFAYVAGWAGTDLICVRQAAGTVTKAARTILGRCSTVSSTDAVTAPDDLTDAG